MPRRHPRTARSHSYAHPLLVWAECQVALTSSMLMPYCTKFGPRTIHTRLQTIQTLSLTGWCRRFQQAHILGIPTIVRDLQPGFDWDADTMMRATRKQHQIKRGGRDVTLTVRCSSLARSVWGVCPRILMLPGPQGSPPGVRPHGCKLPDGLQTASSPAPCLHCCCSIGGTQQ